MVDRKHRRNRRGEVRALLTVTLANFTSDVCRVPFLCSHREQAEPYLGMLWESSRSEGSLPPSSAHGTRAPGLATGTHRPQVQDSSGGIGHLPAGSPHTLMIKA